MPPSPYRPSIPLIVDPALDAIFARYEAYTMIPREYFLENLQLIEFFAARVEGDLVECGTWRGGMSCAMMAIGGPSRSYHFFDSFEGLPDVKPVDGAAAAKYQAEKESPTYFDNCRADEAPFRALVSSQGVDASRIHIHPGWFADTVSRVPADTRISVLRLDGDWYESTMQCLEGLYDKVAEGGLIIIDDYDPWDGCSRAVHDFLSRRSSASRIYRTAVTQVAYIVKHEPA